MEKLGGSQFVLPCRLRRQGLNWLKLAATKEDRMISNWAKSLWQNEEGQDVAEYAVMLAVVLIIVIGTVRLIGGNANNVFSTVSSGLNQ